MSRSSRRPNAPSVAIAACVVALLVTGPAMADDSAKSAKTSDHADAAHAAVEAQHYDDARAIVRDDLGSPLAVRRAPALEIMAETLLLEGHAADAAPYLHALYELAPAFVLTDASLPPRVTDAFAAEAALPHARAVSLAFRSIDDGTFSLDASGRAHPSVFCRHGAGDFASVPLTPLSPVRHGFRLSTTTTNACFAVAIDDDGLPVGRLGSAHAPLVLKPDVTPSSSVASKWWFWSAVGAAVVGGVVLAYVETRPSERSLSPAELTVSGRKETP